MILKGPVFFLIIVPLLLSLLADCGLDRRSSHAMASRISVNAVKEERVLRGAVCVSPSTENPHVWCEKNPAAWLRRIEAIRDYLPQNAKLNHYLRAIPNSRDYLYVLNISYDRTQKFPLFNGGVTEWQLLEVTPETEKEVLARPIHSGLQYLTERHQFTGKRLQPGTKHTFIVRQFTQGANEQTHALAMVETTLFRITVDLSQLP